MITMEIGEERLVIQQAERLLQGAKSREWIRLKVMEMKRNGSRVGKGNLTGFPDDCRRAG